MIYTLVEYYDFIREGCRCEDAEMLPRAWIEFQVIANEIITAIALNEDVSKALDRAFTKIKKIEKGVE